MKLYDVPRNSRIRLVGHTLSSDMELNFHHIDGMYSYCTDDDGNVMHLAAWTEIELVKQEKSAIRAMGED